MRLFVRVAVDDLCYDVYDGEEDERKVACDKSIGSPFSLEKYGPSIQLCNIVFPELERGDYMRMRSERTKQMRMHPIMAYQAAKGWTLV